MQGEERKRETREHDDKKNVIGHDVLIHASRNACVNFLSAIHLLAEQVRGRRERSAQLSDPRLQRHAKISRRKISTSEKSIDNFRRFSRIDGVSDRKQCTAPGVMVSHRFFLSLSLPLFQGN